MSDEQKEQERKERKRQEFLKKREKNRLIMSIVVGLVLAFIGLIFNPVVAIIGFVAGFFGIRWLIKVGDEVDKVVEFIEDNPVEANFGETRIRLNKSVYKSSEEVCVRHNTTKEVADSHAWFGIFRANANPNDEYFASASFIWMVRTRAFKNPGVGSWELIVLRTDDIEQNNENYVYKDSDIIVRMPFTVVD